MGTPAYISPEQAQGQTVDRRSDIYSLGIILYEMVTGSVPFVAETPLAVLFKHISDPLPPPSLVKPDVPPSIEQVILKALAKDPRDRFATVDEFLTAWKRALEQKETVRRSPETTLPPVSGSTPHKPAPSTTTSTRSARPTGWLIGCLAALCLLFSLGGVAVLALNLPIFSSLSATETPLPPTQTATPVPPTEVSFTGRVLLEDDFSVSQDGWGTLTDSESSIEYEGQSLRMRNFTKNYVAWSTPNDLNYQDTHLEVTAFNNDMDLDTAFGFICAQQTEDWSFYYLAITTAGDYAIIRATTGESDVILTNNGQWGSSNLIPKQAPSYRIGADCGHGNLTLYVDGQRIASVSDNNYTSGRVGLFVWSGETVNSSVVTYDDFLVRSLE
jgi:hypothetical protein